MSAVYTINKGINTPLEFKGFQAQYIGYLGGGFLVLLLLFAALYISGLPPFVCLFLIGGSGAGWTLYIYRLSHRYGPYGLLKKRAARSLPKKLTLCSRTDFFIPFNS